MRLHERLTDLMITTGASYLATRVMDQASMKLYEREPAAVRAREDAVRPGSPDRIAA